MTQFTRRNAWDANNGGQFTNIDGSYTDLYWYAKGVAVMKSKPISDPTSWWFYAAIHGQYLINNDGSGDAPADYPNWTDIKSIPATADLSDPPAEKLTTIFWDQCQHGTWFFPPWHRGYLVALENILRDIIVNQFSGPSDWALPYWNYLNQSTQYEEYTIPPAFTASALPDGTPNSLFVPERYGPNGDGNVYLVVGPGTDPNNPEINDEGQWDTKYSESSPGSSNNLNGYFYGGQETGFSHSNGGFGDLESNPHNFVHVMVGGFNGDSWTDPNASASEEGLMADPGVAALDPIFYLHHANIDRMWSAWNVTGNNTNPSAPNWLTGPSALGNSMFAMPLNSNGKPWYYTPSDVETTLNLKYIGSIYSYTYDDLSLTSYDTTPPASLNEKLNQRLLKLGVTGIENNIKMSTPKKTELVGASTKALTLNAKETGAIVTLDTRAWNSVSESLLKASSTKLPDEVYLQLENVKGTNNANFISLFVNDTFVKSVALFGIRMASMKNSPHGGSGLTFKFNITAIIDDLHLDTNFSADALNVQIKTKSPLPEGNQITIDRISVYRVSQ